MIVTLLQQERITNLYLPSKKKGKFWIKNEKTDDKGIMIEGRCGNWFAKSASAMWFLDDDNKYCDKVMFTPFHLYTVQIFGEDTISHIMAEPDIQYKRVRIVSKDNILIGRAKSNDICIDSIAVSLVHARLCKKDDKWIVSDEDSTNGIYVNNQRVKGCFAVEPGDIIYIMGIRIIMGKGFLAINNPKGMVTLNAQCFVPICHKQRNSNIKDTSTIVEYYKPDVNVLTGNEALQDCVDITEKEKNMLWSFTREHPHYLNIRIGKNTIIDLTENSCVCVKGSRTNLEAFAKGILLRIITGYSYKDVKVIAFLDDRIGESWSTVRWLPHFVDASIGQSLFIKNSSDMKQLVNQLQRQNKKNVTNSPFYIVLGWNRQLEQIWTECEMSSSKNVKRISFYDTTIDDVFLWDCVINLENETGNMCTTYKASLQTHSKRVCHTFIPDMCCENIDMLCLELANTYLEDGGINEEIYKVEVYVPAFEGTYDITVSRNEKIGELLSSIKKQLAQKESGYMPLGDSAVLCEREVGIVLDAELTPEESGILNGTRLMLI